MDREFEIKYPIVDPIDVKSDKDQNSVVNEIELNKDHGYFLLVDSPKEEKFKVINFRSTLESRLISEQRLSNTIIE